MDAYKWVLDYSQFGCFRIRTGDFVFGEYGDFYYGIRQLEKEQ